MPSPDSKPSQQTRRAEQSEAHDAHVADRDPTLEEEEVADRFEASRSDEERQGVAEHEQEMAERGAHQKGEGRPE
jgi:hypothetical protein